MAVHRAKLFKHIIYLAEDMGLPGKYNETLGKDLDDMIEFERKLANITVPEEDRRNKSLLYNKLTLKQLITSMTSVTNLISHFNVSLSCLFAIIVTVSDKLESLF